MRFVIAVNGSRGDAQPAVALAAELEVTLPHLDAEAAQQLADQAHEVCPYSNATRGNIDVTVTVVQD